MHTLMLHPIPPSGHGSIWLWEMKPSAGGIKTAAEAKPRKSRVQRIIVLQGERASESPSHQQLNHASTTFQHHHPAYAPRPPILDGPDSPRPNGPAAQRGRPLPNRCADISPVPWHPRRRRPARPRSNVNAADGFFFHTHCNLANRRVLTAGTLAVAVPLPARRNIRPERLDDGGAAGTPQQPSAR
jgi:hypothetical protein